MGVWDGDSHTPFLLGGMMTEFLIPKKPREKNPAFLAFVRELPCLACKRNGADPHHIKSRGAGGDDSGNVVPLCRTHHTMVHTYGMKAFESKFRINMKAFAGEIWKIYNLKTKKN